MNIPDAIIIARLQSRERKPGTSNLWVSLPIDGIDLSNISSKLEIRSTDQIYIEEVRCVIPAVVNIVSEDTDFGMMNSLAHKLEELFEEGSLLKCKAVMASQDCDSIESVLDMAYNLDCFDLEVRHITVENYCKEYLMEMGIDVESPAFRLFRFDLYGRELLEKENKCFTNYGVVSRNNLDFVQYYSSQDPSIRLI